MSESNTSKSSGPVKHGLKIGKIIILKKTDRKDETQEESESKPEFNDGSVTLEMHQFEVNGIISRMKSQTAQPQNKPKRKGRKPVKTILTTLCEEPPIKSQKDKEAEDTPEIKNETKSDATESSPAHDSVVDQCEVSSPAHSDPCEVCGEWFKRGLTFEEHMISNHMEAPYECICGKVYDDAGKFRRHMSSHKHQNTTCDVCGKTFSQASNLRLHKQLHDNQTSHKCQVCGKTFALKKYLVNHSRIHSGQKPFKCKVCSKGFGHASNLSEHMRTHTGEQPYICKACGRGFSQVGSLTRHQRTHTGELPYQCSFCGRQFSQAENARKHLSTHEPRDDKRSKRRPRLDLLCDVGSTSQALPDAGINTVVEHKMVLVGNIVGAGLMVDGNILDQQFTMELP